LATIHPDEAVTFKHWIEFFAGPHNVSAIEEKLHSQRGAEQIGQAGDFAFLM
jgi:hypothetical protein